MARTKDSVFRRFVGVLGGVAVHALFAYTVYELFFFLRGAQPTHGKYFLTRDAILALQFAIPHSWLLLPSVRKKLGQWVSPAFYGLFYCTVTCGSLLITIWLWTPSHSVLWQLTGWPRDLSRALFFLAWIPPFYSLSLTGLGYQTGFTPWWHWVRNRPLPPREFKPRGAYLLLRHPVYLSFLGLIWFTPDMTLDRVVLASIWTPYIFFGSWLKDRRLGHYLGKQYLLYKMQVAGFPGLGSIMRPLRAKTNAREKG